MTIPSPRYLWEKRLLQRSAPEGLSKGAQHLALVMATYAKQDGTRVEPSVPTLQAVTGRSRRNIYTLLGELRDAGWIEQTRRGNNMATKQPRGVIKAGTNALADAHNTTSAYVLTVPPVPPTAP